jgi:putative transposase
VQLVEQRVIGKNDPRYSVIDEAAFKSKNLYNAALYEIKHKTEGRNILVYTVQALSKRGLKRGLVQPSMLAISIKAQQKDIDQVPIVPKKGYYIMEVVYEKDVVQAPINPAWYAGIDIGMNNLVALASNKPGFRPVVVNGRPVKSANQFYNKRKAELQKKLGTTGTTRRLEPLATKRNRRIDHYMHTASRQVIDLLVEEGIGTLVIGKNDGWKLACKMGKRNNQNFVQIPHARFIAMLTYKAELVGITVKVTEKSYTSKASFLDRDPSPVRDSSDGTRHTFSVKRVKRGLYRASGKRDMNADLNGAYNIVCKVAPDAFKAEGVEDGRTTPLCSPSCEDNPHKAEKESVLLRRSLFWNYQEVPLRQ